MGRAVKLEAAERVVPQIYAYALRTAGFEGLLKVGYTARSVAERVREQVGNITLPEGLAPYEILWRGPAVRADGTSFDDHAVHAELKRLGVERVAGGVVPVLGSGGAGGRGGGAGARRGPARANAALPDAPRAARGRGEDGGLLPLARH